MTTAIEALCTGSDLTREQAAGALAEIMEGRAGEVQTGAFLVALRAKGETAGEVAGLAATMRSLATPVVTDRAPLVDTAGTGGGRSSFNVSTAAALVAAGAGCAVAKHGNRSSTSRSGSADVLEALGVRIDLDAAAVGRCIEEAGFGFMFAPAHHAAMRYVVPVRKELAVRTVFNFLGPLTNPAGATRQVIGVSDARFQDVIADALAELGCERAWVVASSDGYDEISIFAPSRIIEVGPGGVSEWAFDPAEHGLGHEPTDAIAGGDPAENAEVIRAVFGGDDGPTRDLVVANAAAAIAVGDDAELPSAIERAREAIDSGAAAAVLDQLVAITGELAPA